MRIAIDARMIKPDSMHGIARYVFHLIAGLIEHGQAHEFFLFISPGSPLSSREYPRHINLIEIDSEWISLKEQWEIPRALRKIRADLFHTPSFVAPLVVPCRMVMTIHDLNHLVLPQFYTPLHQFYYQIIVRNSIRKSSSLLTVSNFSKKEIIRKLGLSSKKVAVTYNGVSEQYQRVDDKVVLNYVREIYGLAERFILCVSNNKPHKNVYQLVKAYCHANVEIPLVLACPVDVELIRLADRHGKKHQLYFSKFIEEAHLPAVYSMTELFVYPSTYEGFGLPPLEALACGVPVVVASSSSLPEVVGNNAIFIDPYNHNSIANALVVGIRNKELRLNLIKNGLVHARQFSWDKMTKKTIETYESCLPQEQLHSYKVNYT